MSQVRRVGIIGNRDYPEPEQVRQLVRRIFSANPDAVLVSGHGGVVDLTAEDEADKLGMAKCIYAPNFERYKGKRAFFERNSLIACNITELHTFRYPFTKSGEGTMDAIRRVRAQRTQIPWKDWRPGEKV